MLGELSAAQIEEVLRTEVIARIGCVSEGRVYVVPVSYVYDGTYVYGHAMDGVKLRAMRANPQVCVEVEQVDDLSNWRSVIAWGTFEECEGADWDAGFEFSGSGFSAQDLAGFSDFFTRMFGHIGREPRGFRPQGGFHAHARDHHAKVLLDLEDSFLGAVRQISLRVPQVDPSGHLSLASRTLNVRIPRGVRAGQIIRLAGQGEAGTAGAPPGDLLLEVEFRSHARYRIEGADLHLDLPLAPWEAALGTVVDIDLPDGTLKVRIPAGAQSGRQLRVRGKGIPSTPPGDLLLDLRIVLPPADTPQAQQLYTTMAQALAFDPRQHWKD